MHYNGKKKLPQSGTGAHWLHSIYPQRDDMGAFLPHPINFSNICLWLKILLPCSLLKQEEEIWWDWTLAAGWDKVGLQEATCFNKCSYVSSFYWNIHCHVYSPNPSFTAEPVEAIARVPLGLRCYLSSEFFSKGLTGFPLPRAARAPRCPATCAPMPAAAQPADTRTRIWQRARCSWPSEIRILEMGYFQKPAHGGGREESSLNTGVIVLYFHLRTALF